MICTKNNAELNVHTTLLTGHRGFSEISHSCQWKGFFLQVRPYGRLIFMIQIRWWTIFFKSILFETLINLSPHVTPYKKFRSSALPRNLKRNEGLFNSWCNLLVHNPSRQRRHLQYHMTIVRQRANYDNGIPIRIKRRHQHVNPLCLMCYLSSSPQVQCYRETLFEMETNMMIEVN